MDNSGSWLFDRIDRVQIKVIIFSGDHGAHFVTTTRSYHGYNICDAAGPNVLDLTSLHHKRKRAE